jgi:hypothetical protein
MDGLNLQASVSNLTQMDRFQHDAHRTPVVNQEQNAQTAQDEASRRIAIPVQPDGVEGKRIDPKQRKRDGNAKKQNRKKGETDRSNGPMKNSGGFLDIRV